MNSGSFEIELHGSFTPLVMSAASGMAPLATCFYHHLNDKLSEKWNCNFMKASVSSAVSLVSSHCDRLFTAFVDFALFPVTLHLEELCLSILLSFCSRLASVAGSIEGLIAFVL